MIFNIEKLNDPAPIKVELIFHYSNSEEFEDVKFARNFQNFFQNKIWVQKFLDILKILKVSKPTRDSSSFRSILFRANSDGNYKPWTNEEEKEFYRSFKQFDRNRDGKLSLSELGAAMRVVGLNPTLKELDEIFVAYDKNR